jgi:hypothetical protein
VKTKELFLDVNMIMLCNWGQRLDLCIVFLNCIGRRMNDKDREKIIFHFTPHYISFIDDPTLSCYQL